MVQMGSVPWFVFLLAVLTVWRVTHLLQAEDGPFDVIARFRRWLGESVFGKLLDCFYCLSIWIAAPAALLIGSDWPERLLLWLALSAAAILVERLHARLLALTQQPTLPPIYHEEPVKEQEETHDVLRK